MMTQSRTPFSTQHKLPFTTRTLNPMAAVSSTETPTGCPALSLSCYGPGSGDVQSTVLLNSSTELFNTRPLGLGGQALVHHGGSDNKKMPSSLIFPEAQKKMPSDSAEKYVCKLVSPLKIWILFQVWLFPSVAGSHYARQENALFTGIFSSYTFFHTATVGSRPTGLPDPASNGSPTADAWGKD